jgi:hypothetical protein
MKDTNSALGKKRFYLEIPQSGRRGGIYLKFKVSIQAAGASPPS